MIIVGDILGILHKPGERGEANAVFFGFLAAFLLPTLLFVVGVHRERSVQIYGAWLFGLTVPAWLCVLLLDGAFRGVYVVPAWVVTLVTSIVGLSRERQPIDEG